MSTTEKQTTGITTGQPTGNRGEVLKLIKNSKNNFIPSIVSQKENLGATVGNTPPNSYPGYNARKINNASVNDTSVRTPRRPNGGILTPVGELSPYNAGQGGGKRKQRRKKTMKKRMYRKKYSFKKTFLK